MLQISMGIAYPDLYKDTPDFRTPTGYETLWFGEDESVWAVYDLATGRMIGSSLPPAEPLRLVIAPVVQVSEASTESLQPPKAVRLSVTGPAGVTAVLESTDSVGGQWTSVHEMVLVAGTNSFVDEVSSTTITRLYRVRLGN